MVVFGQIIKIISSHEKKRMNIPRSWGLSLNLETTFKLKKCEYVIYKSPRKFKLWLTNISFEVSKSYYFTINRRICEEFRHLIQENKQRVILSKKVLAILFKKNRVFFPLYFGESWEIFYINQVEWYWKRSSCINRIVVILLF